MALRWIASAFKLVVCTILAIIGMFLGMIAISYAITLIASQNILAIACIIALVICLVLTI